MTQRRRAAARSRPPAVSAPSVSATAPPVTDVASASVPGGVGSEISGLLESRDLTPLVLLGSIVAALALGAGHALTPGHGKTLMGAYLVGTRGTSIHAIALGLSVTVSHTLGILVLAAIVIAFRGVLPPETFNRYAPVASGLLVLGIGAWLLVGQLRARRTASRTIAHAHGADHDHGPEHDHTAEHAADHHHDVEAGHDHAVVDDAAPESGMHSHGGVRHSHLPPPGSTVTWRSLFVLGLAGGIIPSTNALIILLATIATGRAVYGLVLVIAFGLGMALVLGGVGLSLVLRPRPGRSPPIAIEPRPGGRVRAGHGRHARVRARRLPHDPGHRGGPDALTRAPAGRATASCRPACTGRHSPGRSRTGRRPRPRRTS